MAHRLLLPAKRDLTLEKLVFMTHQMDEEIKFKILSDMWWLMSFH
jgi:hypothetical protein